MNKLMVLKALFAAFPNSKPSEETFAVYLRVVADVPAEELDDVVMQYVNNPGPFPPSAGDLKELWRRSRGMLPAEDGAEQALASIRKAVWEVGYIGTPTFKDSITQRTVDAYGWLNICTSDEPEIIYAQLRKMYEGFAKRAASDARMTPEYKRLVEDSAKRLKALDVEVNSGEEGTLVHIPRGHTESGRHIQGDGNSG